MPWYIVITSYCFNYTYIVLKTVLPQPNSMLTFSLYSICTFGRMAYILNKPLGHENVLVLYYQPVCDSLMNTRKGQQELPVPNTNKYRALLYCTLPEAFYHLLSLFDNSEIEARTSVK